MPKALAVMTVHENEMNACRKSVISILKRNPEIDVLLCFQTDTEGFTPPDVVKDAGRVRTHVMKTTDNPMAALLYGLKQYPRLPMITVKAGINYDSSCLEDLCQLHEKFPNSICTAGFMLVKVTRKDDKTVATCSSLAERRKDGNMANKYYELVCPHETLYPCNENGVMIQWMYENDLSEFPVNEDTAHIFLSILCEEFNTHIRHLKPAYEMPAPSNMERILKAVEEHYDKLSPPLYHTNPTEFGCPHPPEWIEVLVATSTQNRVARMMEDDPSRTLFFVDKEHDEPNIDKFNPWFCELTALYYLHKHSNAKYVGLEHYRRCFVEEEVKGSYDANSYRILPMDVAMEILETNDAIVAFHQHAIGRSAFSYLEISKQAKMFNAWLDIVEQGTPGFKQFCLDRLKHETLICCNMFIARKELIDKYCEWLFANTRAFMAKYPLSEKRYRHTGYLGEFTFGAWLLFNKYKLKLQPHIRFNRELTELEEVERTTICKEEI